MHIHIYTHIYIYIYIHIRMHMHTYTYIYTSVFCLSACMAINRVAQPPGNPAGILTGLANLQQQVLARAFGNETNRLRNSEIFCPAAYGGSAAWPAKSIRKRITISKNLQAVNFCGGDIHGLWKKAQIACANAHPNRPIYSSASVALSSGTSK